MTHFGSNIYHVYLNLGVKKGQKRVKKGSKMGPKSDQNPDPNDPFWVIGIDANQPVLLCLYPINTVVRVNLGPAILVPHVTGDRDSY